MQAQVPPFNSATQDSPQGAPKSNVTPRNSRLKEKLSLAHQDSTCKSLHNLRGQNEYSKMSRTTSLLNYNPSFEKSLGLRLFPSFSPLNFYYLPPSSTRLAFLNIQTSLHPSSLNILFQNPSLDLSWLRSPFRNPQPYRLPGCTGVSTLKQPQIPLLSWSVFLLLFLLYLQPPV